jgi:hypothetical protein
MTSELACPSQHRASEGEIHFRELLGHHPERVRVAALRTEPEAAERARYCRRDQSGLEEVPEVLGGEFGALVVAPGTWRKPFARERAHARGWVIEHLLRRHDRM